MLSDQELKSLYRQFSSWEVMVGMVGFNNNFIRDVYDMRIQMHPKVVLEPLSMLEYKRNMLKYLHKQYVYEVPINYTDEELLTNRTRNNTKITKELNKLIREQSKNYHTFSSLQELDYFHKLRYDDNKYYITADVFDILYAYSEIQTCLSPEGENQANFLEMLASPYFYLVSDLHNSVRMGLLIDYEKKKVFLNKVYGSYDSMIVMTVIKHFVSMGFEFVKNISYFHDDFVNLSYIDTYNCYHQEMIEAMGYDSYLKEIAYSHENVNNLFSLPEGIKVERDLFTGDRPEENVSVSFSLWGNEFGIVSQYERICGSCGDIVDANDFDDDQYCCHFCAEYHCDYCEINYDESDMYDDMTCLNCHHEMLQDAHIDYLIDLEREKIYEESGTYE